MASRAEHGLDAPVLPQDASFPVEHVDDLQLRGKLGIPDQEVHSLVLEARREGVEDLDGHATSKQLRVEVGARMHQADEVTVAETQGQLVLANTETEHGGTSFHGWVIGVARANPFGHVSNGCAKVRTGRR